MSFSNEAIGPGNDGGIYNIFGELPAWMNHQDVGMALVEMDTSVRGIQEPPIAKIFSDSVDPEQVNIEDYRHFYVEFADAATAEDVVTAVRLVSEAIKKFRYAV